MNFKGFGPGFSRTPIPCPRQAGGQYQLKNLENSHGDDQGVIVFVLSAGALESAMSEAAADARTST